MRYYYSIKGEAKGPVEEEELDLLAEQGVIKPNTPVIEVGGTAWSRYSAIRPGNAGVPLPPPVQQASFMEKLLGINTWVDKVLEKIFRMPAFVPSDYEGRMRAMEKMSNLTGLVIWASVILSCMSSGMAVDGSWMIGGLLAGVVYGFIAQYIGYQFYSITNSLLIGQPVLLSSARFPKLIGTMMIVITLAVAIATLVTAEGVGGILLALCAILPCVALIYLCMNAEGLLVKVSPAEVSPGREFNNSIKFILRAIFAAVHVLTPVMTILAALSACFTAMTMDSKALAFGGAAETLLYSGISVIVLLHLPLVTWLLLCISSWLLDLIDAAFARGSRNSD